MSDCSWNQRACEFFWVHVSTQKTSYLYLSSRNLLPSNFCYWSASITRLKGSPSSSPSGGSPLKSLQFLQMSVVFCCKGESGQIGGSQFESAPGPRMFCWTCRYHKSHQRRGLDGVVCGRMGEHSARLPSERPEKLGQYGLLDRKCMKVWLHFCRGNGVVCLLCFIVSIEFLHLCSRQRHSLPGGFHVPDRRDPYLPHE